MKSFVSIIVVNYNGKHLLKTILNSILKSNFNNYEILVVDNASKDGSTEFVRKNYKNVKLVENRKNLGYSGINSALKFCKGQHILFLNNDMEIDKNCISELVKTIESDKNIAMAAPKLINFYNKSLKSGGTWISRAFYNGHIKGTGKESAKEIPYLGVGLIKNNFVDKFGYLFDPDYFIYAEDVDLGLRIRLNGKKIVFQPNAMMYHMHSVTTQKSGKSFSTFLMERNLLTTAFKILSIQNIVLFLPYIIFARFLAIFKDILSLEFGTALSRTKVIFWILLNINFIAAKRSQVQKFRTADDKYILRVFSEQYLIKPKFNV